MFLFFFLESKLGGLRLAPEFCEEINSVNQREFNEWKKVYFPLKHAGYSIVTPSQVHRYSIETMD